MTNYLIRRIIQMGFVILLSTLAIYMLLNVAPGGPLSGLRTASADRRQQVSEADIKRLEAYLGIDKPLLLRYVAWLIGDDWMGADWMYVGLMPYTTPSGKQARFWADPGVAHLKPGVPVWVSGARVGSTVEATTIEARPTGSRPENVVDGKVLNVTGTVVTLELGESQKLTVNTSSATEFIIPGATPVPSDGQWLNISWLFGAEGLFGSWAGFRSDNQGVFRLDWGTSWKIANGQPVLGLVESRLGNTLLLMTLTTVVSLIVAIPIGIVSAVKQYSRLDYTATTFAFFGSAMPVFWFGLMMILLFSFSFRSWGLPNLPAGGVMSPRAAPAGSLLDVLNATPGGALDRGVHLIMPTIVLSLLYMAGWSRFMRSSMLEVLRQDYVRAARAKGLLERLVISKHALRNALIPMITIVALQLPTLFSGAILTETIFAYPGMGRLYFQALGVSDWPVVMILLLITAVLVVIATLLRDVAYTIVDPRIRYD